MGQQSQYKDYNARNEIDEPNNTGDKTNPGLATQNFDDFLSNSRVNFEDKIVPLQRRSFFSGVMLPSIGFLILAIAALFLIGDTDLFARLTGTRLSDILIASNRTKDARISQGPRLQVTPSFLSLSEALNDGRLMRSAAYRYLIAPNGAGFRKRSFLQDKALADWTDNTWEKIGSGQR
jgi:hypothetical protein